MPLNFVLGRPLALEETRHVEFKEVKSKKPLDVITNAADEYAVAFLNSGEEGRIYWGVRDLGSVVVGVPLTQEQRDQLRRKVMGKLGGIQPSVDPTQFRLHLHPVASSDATLEVFVVELRVPSVSSSDPFYTEGHEAWVRLDGVKTALKGPRLTEWIKNRSKTRRVVVGSVTDPGSKALVQRMRQVFASHGLETAHLPRFFDVMKAPFTFSLLDGQTDGALLAWLDDRKIQWIADVFQIQREWIDGESDYIHWMPHFDKHPEVFWKTVQDEMAVAIDSAMPQACFIRMGKGKDWGRRGNYSIFVVLAIPLIQLSSERTVFRYISCFSEYPWDYARTRIQLRAWARLLSCHERFWIRSLEMTIEAGQSMSSNNVFLRDLIEDPTKVSGLDWHIDDYALNHEESAVAKDVDSLPDVLSFLEKSGLPSHCTKFSRSSLAKAQPAPK